MAFPNVSDVIATTIENRSRRIADNVTKNNALLARLKKKGNIRKVTGGSKIYEELSFAENTNAGWYSGYDILPVAPQDVLSAAEYNLKQAACAVIISGMEMLQNSGKEALISLIDKRVGVAEKTMLNLLAGGVYSDGTGSGGKQLTGLNAAVPANPATATYGGINRATWTFWRPVVEDPAVTPTKDTIRTSMNTLWSKLVRGMDRPDLIVFDSVLWNLYVEGLQAQQRFTDPSSANLGFPSLKFMDCDVVLDGGVGGFCPASTGFFLNSDYLFYRPHSDRDMVPLSPSRRYAINQDAEVQILGWAGEMTCSNQSLQGRLIGT